jgi:hypothetical protein
METQPSLDIRRLPLKKLTPWERNPRQIDPDALAGLEASIREFGLVEPVIWNERTGHVVGGHQRLKVLQKQGVLETDVVVVDLPQEREAALNLSLNNPAIAGVFTEEAEALLGELRDYDSDLVGDLLLDRILGTDEIGGATAAIAGTGLRNDYYLNDLRLADRFLVPPFSVLDAGLANALVFCKGNPQEATKACGQVEIALALPGADPVAEAVDATDEAPLEAPMD